MGEVAAAVATVLAFTAYLRPGEPVALKTDDLVRPTGRGCYALNLHPSARGCSSKTGDTDESLMLDAPYDRWLGPALCSRRGRDSRF